MERDRGRQSPEIETDSQSAHSAFGRSLEAWQDMPFGVTSDRRLRRMFVVRPTLKPRESRQLMKRVGIVALLVVLISSGVAYAGSSWTSSSLVAPVGTSLNAVACPSKSLCLAVGHGPFGAFTAQLVAGKWSILGNPYANLDNGVPLTQLRAIACTSQSNCWAVGSSQSSAGGILHWDGTTWSSIQDPAGGGGIGTGPLLHAISCPSVTNCWATGSWAGNSALIEHWNGANWSIAQSPNAPHGSSSPTISGLACTSGANCWAVGGGGDEKGTPFLEHWNGSMWHVSYFNTKTTGVSLSAISCPSSRVCWIVGYTDGGFNGKSGALVIRLENGVWSQVANPMDTQAQGANNDLLPSLNAIACAGPQSCIAVGTRTNSQDRLPLVLAMAKGRWSVPVLPTNALAKGLGEIDGVLCTDLSHCIAVGSWQHNLKYGISLDPLVIQKT